MTAMQNGGCGRDRCTACGRPLPDCDGMTLDGETYCASCVIGGTPAHWAGGFDEEGDES